MTVAEAVVWREQTAVAVRAGRPRVPVERTLGEAAEEWLRLARQGVVRTRGGDRYKPSAIRSYEKALGRLPVALTARPVAAVTRNELQDVVDGIVAAGRAPSTARNALMPLRAIYRRAVAREEVPRNPTLGRELPSVRGRRERVARPEEATALIAALAPADRALWTTALYAGLRLGELLALRWADLDFDAGLIRVEHAWDPVEGLIDPKSRAGRRRVPMSRVVRAALLEHGRLQGWAHGFVFGRSAQLPFYYWSTVDRAKRAWKRAGLAPIGLHECRHTYAAFMIAAGVNAKSLSTYMGHSSITVTLDRYGHLLPGNEGAAAADARQLARAHRLPGSNSPQALRPPELTP